VLRTFHPATPESLLTLDRAGRWKNRADLDAAVAAACADHEIAEITGVCQEHRVPVAPVLEVGEALETPQVKSRGLIIDLPLRDEGVIRVLNIPVRLKGTPGYVSHCAPDFASSNDELLG
jgi:crotonobetainyl-CoA:carnitine CoA-transferase CaiB-like acyl-CoA transferase